MRLSSSSSGQAMLETVLAVLCISVLFLFFFHLSQVAMTRTLVDHAAARAARARTVGFNDFMCVKSARVAAIPVAGERLWPEEDMDELGRIPDYLASEDGARARGILEYEYWPTLHIDVSRGFGSRIRAKTSIVRQEGMFVKGEAEIESHYAHYMDDAGL